MQGFDPFNDRMSRDIRNRLSEAFVSALRQGDSDLLQREAKTLSDLTGKELYRQYIQDRLIRYERVLERAKRDQLHDPKLQALCIWNAGLFFECHEHLEGIWQHAKGEERKAIQGVIKAAGVFVHRGLGRESSANRLSPKALDLILANRGRLAFIENLNDLIAALRKHGATAPQLKGI